MSDKDVDAQFADIVAHWDDVAALPEDRVRGYAASTPADGSAPAPPVPPVSPEDPQPDQAGPSSANAPRPGVNPPPEMGFVVWRGASPGPGVDDVDDRAETADRADAVEDDEDEHFHPGPTAPLPPQEDLHFWGIVVGLVAGPLLLLWLVIFRPAVSGWWTLGALGLTVGGFVLLVMRQPHTRDEDDPDDGARI